MRRAAVDKGDLTPEQLAAWWELLLAAVDAAGYVAFAARNQCLSNRATAEGALTSLDVARGRVRLAMQVRGRRRPGRGR